MTEDVDQYKKCRECKYYEVLQEPDTGDLIGHQCVIAPDCIYELERDERVFCGWNQV